MNASTESAERTGNRNERLPPEQSHWASSALRGVAYLLTFVAGGAITLAVYTAYFGQRAVEAGPVRREVAKEETPALKKAAEPVLESPMPQPAPPPMLEVQAERRGRFAGVTEPAPDRFAKLPLATQQAVAFVDVRPGDHIKKGHQVFSHWESPERLQAIKTEFEKTKKLFELAETRKAAAVRTLARIEKLGTSASRQDREDAETAVSVRTKECEAADLAVSQAESNYIAMEFEFKQAFVTSPIDGIVASVDVLPGERRLPGGAFRGVTILDPSVLHCRCLLSSMEVQGLQSKAKGEPILGRVFLGDASWPAKVVWIGIQADAERRLPVVLEIQNPEQTLQSGIKVEVSFDNEA